MQQDQHPIQHYKEGPRYKTRVSDRAPDEWLYSPKLLELMTNKLKGEEFRSESIEIIDENKGIYKVWKSTQKPNETKLVNITEGHCTCGPWCRAEIPCWHMFGVFKYTK